ncbi:hypothetical protein GUJ93_ZPchr0005g16255 [Zizania palustris]|uniref:Uncharacterized protein n=1 Tax=Zizania palustris TaxID=103762 RepID=A0A8J5W0Z0_ZIZPA|nr:hypothetical protein GUJ93_ZPchr0005g16255 [Zizania palustris]
MLSRSKTSRRMPTVSDDPLPPKRFDFIRPLSELFDFSHPCLEIFNLSSPRPELFNLNRLLPKLFNFGGQNISLDPKVSCLPLNDIDTIMEPRSLPYVSAAFRGEGGRDPLG